MPKRQDLTGRDFHYWHVESYEGQSESRHALYRCKCKCGTVRIMKGILLTSGSKSCGCWRRERATKHGHQAKHKKSPTYISWMAMLARCYNVNHENYPSYGGRGVTVCERWRKSFAAFLADMGQRPEGKTLDRIDPNGNYEPGNCKWSTRFEQDNNKRDTDIPF